MCGMDSLGALVGHIGRRTQTLSWLGLPLLVGGVVLAALWMIPVAAPTVHVRWADEVNAAQRAAVERQRSLVNGTLRQDGSWAYLLEDTSYTNVALIVQGPVVDDTYGIDRDRFEVVRPAVVRPLLRLAPLQSFLGFGLGLLLLVGSIAATRQRRTVYATLLRFRSTWTERSCFQPCPPENAIWGSKSFTRSSYSNRPDGRAGC